MKIISPKYILTQDKLLKEYSIIFDKNIVDIIQTKQLNSKHKSYERVKVSKDSLLIPSFINIHTHLEFSSNNWILSYGSFSLWLSSIFKNREKIFKNSTKKIILESIKNMLQKGTTTIGAISSNGYDLQACVDTPMRVVYFNELIGAKSEQATEIFNNFKNRIENSLQYKSSKFIPAVALHSPYSLSKELATMGVDYAKKYNLNLSAHFCESDDELLWLNNSSGGLHEIFKTNLNITKSNFSSELEFLKLFDNYPTMFVHLNRANKSIINRVKEHNHTIVHCPVSNRFITNDKLDITNIDNIALATDGLSSNYTTDVLNEAKIATLMHYNIDINILAKKVFQMITTNPAKSLNLKLGDIKRDYISDFLIIDNKGIIDNLKSENIYLKLLFEEYKFNKVFIEGEEIYGR